MGGVHAVDGARSYLGVQAEETKVAPCGVGTRALDAATGRHYQARSNETRNHMRMLIVTAQPRRAPQTDRIAGKWRRTFATTQLDVLQHTTISGKLSTMLTTSALADEMSTMCSARVGKTST